MQHDLVKRLRQHRSGRAVEGGLALLELGSDARRQDSIEGGEANRARPQCAERSKRRGDARGIVNRQREVVVPRRR